MIFCLFFHSCVIVLILSLYSRWLDEETLADLCLYGLLVELLFGIFNVSSIYYTDSIFFLNLGSLLGDQFVVNINLVFCFDELSGFFFGILDFALILCFYFLVEYFEYDSNSSGIILLSSMFSHFAMWYFCVFDLFLLIAFWEAISLISFLLIQHWSYRLPTYKAGIKVFFISQLGDLPLFTFIFMFLNRFGTSDLTEILSQLFLTSFDYIVFENLNICVSFSSFTAFLLSFALLLKSAQFFFYPWLLDAMEAPVPISAQLHSSTLVIIGFYFYLRFQNLFIIAPNISTMLTFFGVATVVGASVLGFFQEDGKKLLACSTASQLGYAVTGLSLYYFEESLLLMTFCCCNKAFTFIWFGTLMDRYAGVSDFRFISGVQGLSVLEHAGLLISLMNFTIMPGAFSWHVKSLFLKGQYSFELNYIKYALDVLSLTWFFSSLYLIYLYLILFLKPSRGLLRHSAITPDYQASVLAESTHLNTYNYTSLRAISAFKLKFYSVLGYQHTKNGKITALLSLTNFYYAGLRNFSLTSASPRRMSTSFFLILFFSFIILVGMSNLFFYTYADTTWIIDSFFFNYFFLINFYN